MKLLWIIIYGFLILSIYKTIKLIIYNLYQPIFYSILIVSSLITLFGFELFAMSSVSHIIFENENENKK